MDMKTKRNQRSSQPYQAYSRYSESGTPWRRHKEIKRLIFVVFESWFDFATVSRINFSEYPSLARSINFVSGIFSNNTLFNCGSYTNKATCLVWVFIHKNSQIPLRPSARRVFKLLVGNQSNLMPSRMILVCCCSFELLKEQKSLSLLCVVNPFNHPNYRLWR